MRSMRRCAATSIPGWRSFSTSPNTGASKSRAFRYEYCARPKCRHSTMAGTTSACWRCITPPALRSAKAATNGFAIVGVTNSWMSGRSAYYVEMIANADLIGIHTAGSSRTVAPPGGRRPALGTNPIAFGLPSSRGPIVFDMGTSAFMGTDLVYRERMGQRLPKGVAIDEEGQPTCDPTLARAGALLPFGGYKGFGLAFVVQALGLLAGPAPDPDSDDGYLFLVFKPDLLADMDGFKQQLSVLIDRIKATPRQPGVSEIRMPGERAIRSREKGLREGIEVDRLVYEALARLHA